MAAIGGLRMRLGKVAALLLSSAIKEARLSASFGQSQTLF